jgi:PAS domain S-box-containing protein
MLIRNDQGQPFDTAGIWVDITANKEAEHALQESEKKYRLLAEHSADVIWTVNKLGKFTFISPSVERLTGYNPDEAIGLSISDMLVRESFEKAMAVMEKWVDEISPGASGNDPVGMELEHYCKDGSKGWVEVIAKPMRDADGCLTGFIGVTRNIYERRQAQEALRIAEQRARGLIEHAPDGIVMVSRDGQFLYASPPASRMFGYGQADLSQFNPDDLTHPDDRPMVLMTLEKLMQDPALVPTIQYRFRHLNGERRWIESTFSNLINVPGIEAVVINFHDITRRKAAEEELIRAREKAEESDRLKSAFLANMSHEIRTPMNAIVGFAEMLSNPDLPTAERYQYSSIIQSRSGDLMHIINDLLEISRIESGNAMVVKSGIILNDLIDEMETVFTQKIRRAGKEAISLHGCKGLATPQSGIITDGYILRQVFTNLLDNAIKYTLSGAISFGYQPPADGFIAFYVTYQGIGIAPEKHQVIFEHFRQADIENQHTYGGTGLGLSICKGSLALLGGKIRVESQPGKGSTFRFTLPYEQLQDKEPEQPVKTGSDPIARPGSWKGKRFMLVEDEETNMEFLTIILSGTGAELVPVFNGRDVRSLFSELARFDLVLLDVRLPDANGWELAKEIKSQRPDLPVIAQTAFAMPADRQKSEESGCDGFISKPIRRDLLLQLISDFV